MYLIKSRFIYILLVALNFYHCEAKTKLIQLDEENWDSMLTGEWMVEFFAPWCPACKALNPIWKDFADWSKDLGISVGQIDVTDSPELSGRFMVTALPTIFHIKDGNFRQYRGPREKEEFMSFIEEKKWEGTEQVSAWKNPSSLQMAVIAKLFKLSMVLRSVHSTLTEEFGFPPWASYIAYAVVTIVVGALLGLILVCIIDVLFPPGPPDYVAAGKKSDEEDLKDNEDEKKSASDGEKSASDVEKSASDGEKSASDGEKSASDEEKSASDEEKSASDGDKSKEDSDGKESNEDSDGKESKKDSDVKESKKDSDDKQIKENSEDEISTKEVEGITQTDSPSVRKRKSRKAD